MALGVLGLGIMGSAIASNLIKAGHEVWGHDPRASARQSFARSGGHRCTSPRDLIKRCNVIVTSLPSAQALFDVTQALAEWANKKTIVIETSTLALEDKSFAHQTLKKKGIHLLDCPLSGTGAQALNKDLTVYASGSSKAIKQVAPIFLDFAKAVFDLGEFGNGMRMKLMANLLVAVHNVSTAEALLMGQRWGIPIDRSIEVLKEGAGGSRMLAIRGPLMQDQKWETATMKVGIWQKDMKLIANALSELAVPSPLFSATQAIYNAAMGMGHEEHDTASVFDVLDRMSRPGKK